MPQNLKQFNFKLPESLFKQLEELSKLKGVTKTELVIQGIQHVLGFKSDKAHVSGIDSQLYQQLDNLEQRFQEAVDYQNTVDLETNKRIRTLEEMVENLQAQLSIPDIATSVVDVSVENIPASDQNIVDDIASSLDLRKAKNSSSLDIDKDIASHIDNSATSPLFSPDPVEVAQLELTGLELNNNDLEEKSKIVDSVKMLEILKLEDPQGGWNNSRLTQYRRTKGLLGGKWHKVGNIQFKYADKPKEATKSNKAIYSWLVIQLDED